MNKIESSEHGRALAAIGASKGGKARTSAMTPEERSALAQRAAEVRWGKAPIPQALHTGILPLAGVEFPCAVLEDGTRVLAEMHFMQGMKMYRSGALSTRRKTDPSRAHMPLSLAHKNLQPFISKHLGDVHTMQVRYRTPTGQIAHGVRAEAIPKVCEIWMDASEAHVLGSRQEQVAAQARIIMRALAHVGIIALVDEVTGFQDFRRRDALAKILEAFVRKEIRKWVRTFEPDFYKELFRLREIPYTASPQKPAYIGHLTNDLVYQRLAPGVLKELQSRNAKDDHGRRKHKHHQWLTEDIGHPKLKEHLAAVTALMKACDSWPQFVRAVNRALPPYGKTLELPMNDPASTPLAVLESP